MFGWQIGIWFFITFLNLKGKVFNRQDNHHTSRIPDTIIHCQYICFFYTSMYNDAGLGFYLGVHGTSTHKNLPP